ncbi:phenylalanine--tRNA ligase subunit beta [Stutzerimonas urumqiensis]|uniref:phenylalanine--tRNA ligase subunit beta n=1 Tax=Stutzerimonas urumqiensis TaxID=638269 RepID=UPI003BAB95A8
MKFSEQWLRAWVNPPVGREELVARLSMVGLEVDSVSPVAGAFSGVVVGEVIETEQHPAADKLRVCRVSDGQDIHQVVCGAPNVRPGLKIPFAKIGAQLPGDFTIKKAKLRGVESNGMLCSEVELRIGEDDSGLMELTPSAPVGMDLRSFLDLDDAVIEIGLTPNRGDCLSIAGLAREVGAVYGVPVSAESVEPVQPSRQDELPIDVAVPKVCPRYLGRVIRNVDLSRPAPQWLIERLRRSDIRSIDAVVDITNYVMLELGQPMHAFDVAEIKGGVRVRMAEEGEKLTLLDGREVSLGSDTLVIADHERPLAIAGVMGGEHSGVSSATQDIFLESAFFDPVALAGKARAYGLHTDSSHRFERGVDFDLPRKAMERATTLLLEIVGGEPGPVIEVSSPVDLPQRAPITLRAERITQMLGLALDEHQIERSLTALGLEVERLTSTQAWQVIAPSHRFDLAIEVDLIEELGRLYGYDRLPVRYPQARLAPKARPETSVDLSDLRRLLVARGYQEAITYSFIDPESMRLFAPADEPLLLANPISSDMAAMRVSLWPGLVKALQYNLNRQQSRVRLFEAGMRFVGQLDQLKQENVIAGLACGSRLPEGWANGQESIDFFDIKADTEALLGATGDATAFRFCAGEHPALHPGQTARVERNGVLIGYVGALHPELARTLGVEQPVYLFELLMAGFSEGCLPAFTELSRFPEVRRDLAILVPRSVAADDLVQNIRAVAGEWLSDLKLFDVYQGKGIDPLSKSVAVGLTWQHPSRTLTDEEVSSAMQRILTSLEETFNATLRK